MLKTDLNNTRTFDVIRHCHCVTDVVVGHFHNEGRAIKSQVFCLIASLLFVALNNFMGLRFCHQTVTVLFCQGVF